MAKFCTACGSALNYKDKFCSYCGCKVEEEKSSYTESNTSSNTYSDNKTKSNDYDRSTKTERSSGIFEGLVVGGILHSIFHHHHHHHHHFPGGHHHHGFWH